MIYVAPSIFVVNVKDFLPLPILAEFVMFCATRSTPAPPIYHPPQHRRVKTAIHCNLSSARSDIPSADLSYGYGQMKYYALSFYFSSVGSMFIWLQK